MRSSSGRPVESHHMCSDPPHTPDAEFVRTSDLNAKEYPRFRILIVGRTGTGRSSLIHAAFNTPLASAGIADVNEEIKSTNNKDLILHDSQGYEPGNVEKFQILEEFITERCQKKDIAEKLHAIWLCIDVPYAGGRIFETGDERIFELNRNEVPIIVVFTKFDLFLTALHKRGEAKDPISLELAEKIFKKKHGPVFDKLTKNIGGQIPYALVSIRVPETLKRLVKITMKSIRAKTPTLFSRIVRIRGALFNRSIKRVHLRGENQYLAEFAFARAQRVDMDARIAASIKVAKKGHWRTMVAGIRLLNVSLQEYLYTIHKGIIRSWTSNEFLITDSACHRMMVLVGDLNHQNISATQSKTTMALVGASLAKVWRKGVYQQRPEHMRCLMGYVVDLTLIQQAIFLASLQHPLEEKDLEDRVNEIIYEFCCSRKKDDIHNEIREFVATQDWHSKTNVVNKIESLIKANEIDIRFDRKRDQFTSLLIILRFELIANGLTINKTILGLVRELLNLPDCDTSIASSVKNISDVELLLDFFLYLLRNDSLSNAGIQNANRKTRNLMFKLLCKADVRPRTLVITDISYTGPGSTGTGDPRQVFEGEHQGQQITLTALRKTRLEDAIFKKRFHKQALEWKSLDHTFVLPLLGIFEQDPSRLFFVSPSMINGTLTQWRKSKNPCVAVVQTRILEVAKGVQYIHAEGIVHGDLCGENILLDSDFHCRIANFGLAQATDVNFPRQSTTTLDSSDPSPEQFGIVDERPRDVQAFGCLYYEVFFDVMPSPVQNEPQSGRLGTGEDRLNQSDTQTMDDNILELINNCRKSNPSERPTMEHVVTMHMRFTPLPALLATLRELTVLGRSIVNEITLRLIHEILNLPELFTKVTELKTFEPDCTCSIDRLFHLANPQWQPDKLGHPGCKSDSQKVVVQANIYDKYHTKVFVYYGRQDPS
ncbi:hypothetical protein F5887DRAFT_2985 [Amanita rubescens]|nr:hypothetical protein F5887DRAFT_2985 [Amanita rubescens]